MNEGHRQEKSERVNFMKPISMELKLIYDSYNILWGLHVYR